MDGALAADVLVRIPRTDDDRHSFPDEDFRANAVDDYVVLQLLRQELKQNR